jgi:hypothetical protein
VKESAVPKTRFDAQVLTQHLRWGRVAAMTVEDHLASGDAAPVVRVRKPPTFLQLQAQRRNVLRSTGPRTTDGKRRAALNSTKWRQCSKVEQMIMALEGRNPFEYRRLHRQLIYWFAPWDTYSRRLVADLAEVWWDKLGAPRAKRARKRRYASIKSGAQDGRLAKPQAARRLDHRLEHSFGVLISALASRSRKWKYLLGARLRKPIQHCKTASDLAREMERQLKAARIPARNPQVTRMKKNRMDTGENRNREENALNIRDVIL